MVEVAEVSKAASSSALTAGSLSRGGLPVFAESRASRTNWLTACSAAMTLARLTPAEAGWARISGRATNATDRAGRIPFPRFLVNGDATGLGLPAQGPAQGQ